MRELAQPDGAPVRHLSGIDRSERAFVPSLRLLAERGIRPIDFAGWKKVDAFERAEGAKEGREHKKVIEPDQMRELALA